MHHHPNHINNKHYFLIFALSILGSALLVSIIYLITHWNIHYLKIIDTLLSYGCVILGTIWLSFIGYYLIELAKIAVPDNKKKV